MVMTHSCKQVHPVGPSLLATLNLVDLVDLVVGIVPMNLVKVSETVCSKARRSDYVSGHSPELRLNFNYSEQDDRISDNREPRYRYKPTCAQRGKKVYQGRSR